jgi:hypothetical protein
MNFTQLWLPAPDNPDERRQAEIIAKSKARLARESSGE